MRDRFELVRRHEHMLAQEGLIRRFAVLVYLFVYEVVLESEFPLLFLVLDVASYYKKELAPVYNNCLHRRFYFCDFDLRYQQPKLAAD